MNYRQWYWVVAFGVGLIVEGIGIVRGDPLLTDAMRNWMGRFLFPTAVLGVLCGHFVGESTLDPRWAWGVGAMAAAVFIRDFGWAGVALPQMMHINFFLIFFALGATFCGARYHER